MSDIVFPVIWRMVELGKQNQTPNRGSTQNPYLTLKTKLAAIEGVAGSGKPSLHWQKLKSSKARPQNIACLLQLHAQALGLNMRCRGI